MLFVPSSEMRLLLFYLTSLCVALIPGLHGQSLESLVREAVLEAFSERMPEQRFAPPPPSADGAGFLPTGTKKEQFDIWLIILNKLFNETFETCRS